jgi:hypothetical protein
MVDTIDSAALHVAEAEHKLEEANGKLAAAQKAAGEINARVAAIDAERAEIFAAARAGDDDGRLGLRLAILTADGDDLRKIAADAKTGLANAVTEVERAKLAVAAAEQTLRLVKDDEMERHLVAHVDQLAVLLGSGIAELRAIWARKRARPVWAPSKELATEIQRLRLVADNRALAA